MISSPCKNCPNRYQDKEKCMKDCKILQAIQELQISFKEKGEFNLAPAIDCADEGRFSIAVG